MDVYWYEDGNIMECVGEDRKTKECSLEEAIQFAWENKMCLYIQPELQDAGLIIDYSI